MYRADPDAVLVRADNINNVDATHSPALLMGGEGLSSTAQGYARFCRMLRNGGKLDGVRLLNPTAVALMTTDHIDDMPRNVPLPEYLDVYGFGLGSAVRHGVGGSPRNGSQGEYF